MDGRPAVRFFPSISAILVEFKLSGVVEMAEASPNDTPVMSILT